MALGKLLWFVVLFSHIDLIHGAEEKRARDHKESMALAVRSVRIIRGVTEVSDGGWQKLILVHNPAAALQYTLSVSRTYGNDPAAALWTYGEYMFGDLHLVASVANGLRSGSRVITLFSLFKQWWDPPIGKVVKIWNAQEYDAYDGVDGRPSIHTRTSPGLRALWPRLKYPSIVPCAVDRSGRYLVTRERLDLSRATLLRRWDLKTGSVEKLLYSHVLSPFTFRGGSQRYLYALWEESSRFKRVQRELCCPRTKRKKELLQQGKKVHEAGCCPGAYDYAEDACKGWFSNIWVGIFDWEENRFLPYRLIRDIEDIAVHPYHDGLSFFLRCADRKSWFDRMRRSIGLPSRDAADRVTMCNKEFPYGCAVVPSTSEQEDLLMEARRVCFTASTVDVIRNRPISSIAQGTMFDATIDSHAALMVLTSGSTGMLTCGSWFSHLAAMLFVSGSSYSRLLHNRTMELCIVVFHSSHSVVTTTIPPMRSPFHVRAHL